MSRRLPGDGVPVASALRRAVSASFRNGGSMNATGWPGVVLSDGRNRLILDRSCSSLVFQRSQGEVWRRLYVGGDLLEIVRASGLRHDVPAHFSSWALAVATAAVASRLGILVEPERRRSYWLRDDYPGVIRTSGNVRLVADLTRRFYAIQWHSPVGESPPWVTQCISESAATLGQMFLDKAFDPEDRSLDLVERLAALLDGVPDDPGELPGLAWFGASAPDRADHGFLNSV